MKKIRNLYLVFIFFLFISQFNVIKGQNVFPDTGFVGIGILNPSYELDVHGNVRISNNLYVGGGIIISEKVNATKEVQTDLLKSVAVRADSIIMDSTKAFYGYSKFAGDVKLESKLDVYGNATVFGDLKANGNLYFNSNKVISYSPAFGTTPQLYGFGSLANPLAYSKSLDCNASQPQPNSIFQIQGMYHSWGYANNDINFLNVMQMGFDGSNAIIDIAGSNPASSYAPRLLINYWCGKDIFMNTGDNGGNVIMSRLGKVGIGTEILDEKLNVFGAGKFYGTGDNYVKIWFNGAHGNIESNEDILLNFYSGKNVVIGGQSPWSSHPTGDLYANHNAYLARLDGKVGIGTVQLDAGSILTVNGKIKAEEIEVVQNVLPDYVFEKDYSLMTLTELEQFIIKNKHLPEFPSAEYVKENGLQLGETNALLLKKIEEQTLYIINLNKRIEDLEKLILSK